MKHALLVVRRNKNKHQYLAHANLLEVAEEAVANLNKNACDQFELSLCSGMPICWP